MKRIRVAVLADYLEEGWPSMDLIAERLCQALESRQGRIQPVLVRPVMRRRFGRLPGAGARGALFDRLTNRYGDYPRRLARRRPETDLFHVIDHSYAHLVHRLPAARTVVTCHDLDAFAPILDGRPAQPWLFRRLVVSTLRGLQRAARVVCVSEAVRDQLEARRLVPASRLCVVPNGVEMLVGDSLPPAAIQEADRLLGAAGEPGTPTLLHVGSTIPRKRIDVLLRAFAEVVRARPHARLIRVGGLTEAQRRLAADLGVSARILDTPFVDRAVLLAIYRRANVTLLTSDAEGFGLPVLESLAAGVPVVASDLPALRQTGGDAAVYCPTGDAAAFARAVLAVVCEEGGDRCRRGLERAAQFTWAAYAERMEAIYVDVAADRSANAERQEQV